MENSLELAERTAFDFVPDKVVIGKIKTNFAADLCEDALVIDKDVPVRTCLSIPSCRYKDGLWTQSYAFKRLTGFMPNVQRNDEEELKKAMFSACETIDNRPTSGFKLVSFCEDIYSGNRTGSTEALVYDPRGFVVQISLDDIASMLSENNGILDRFSFGDTEYVYIAEKRGMTLIPYQSKQCQRIIKAQNNEKEDGKIKYIKPSELIVGHAYQTSMYFNAKFKSKISGTYIYAGKMMTYSICDEVNQCVYDGFVSKYPPKGKQRHVFFLAESSQKKSSTTREVSIEDMILMASSPSKMFSNEVSIKDDWRWAVDPTKKIDIDSINEFISSSPAFQPIDFERYHTEKDRSLDDVDEMSFDCFLQYLITYRTYKTEFPISYSDQLVLNDFSPYSSRNMSLISKEFMKSCYIEMSFDSWKCLSYVQTANDAKTIVLSNIGSLFSYSNSTSTRQYVCDSLLLSLKNMTLKQIYDKVKPVVPKVFLKNGAKVSPLVSMCIFNKFKVF